MTDREIIACFKNSRDIENIRRVAHPKQRQQKSVNVVTIFDSKKVIEIVMFKMNERTQNLNVFSEFKFEYFG